jgi:CheY-like chemotaxis protein/KaiC/GvpD/RAD55 family RecA-like ATPase
VIGGLAPGLPLVLSGPSGCGRTVLTLELAAAALAGRGIAMLLTAEPAPLLLRQADTLGIDLRGAVESEQLLLLELDARAPASLAAAGGRAFGETLLAEHPAVSMVLIDPFTALTREILDEAPLRAVARELVAALPRASLVLGVETGRPGIEAPVERVLSEVCGSFVSLGRDAEGRRTLSVGKTRAGAGAAEAVEFRIGERGTELVRELEAASGRGAGGATAPGPASPPRAAARPAPAPVPEAAPAAATPAAEAAPAGRRKRRPDDPATILLVEDDASLRAKLCAWLEPRHAVVVATDGLQALSALLGGKPDCIVLELGMSRITGYEVLATLHRAAQAIPILVLAESTRRASERVGPLVLGAADVLAKPVQAFELLHKVDILLRLEGPPPTLVDPDDAQVLFGSVSPTRTLAAPEFRDRLARACAFGSRFGTPSTLLALSAPASGPIDAVVAAADRQLRFEDAALLVSKSRALLLLVAAEPGVAPRVVKRLVESVEKTGASAQGLCWRAWEARPPEEIGDWRTLFRDLEEIDAEDAE